MTGTRDATYEDVLAAPEHTIAQVIDGRLHIQPLPDLLHANAALSIGGSLIRPFRLGQGGPGGWVILNKLELHVSKDILVPDLAGWRRERLADVPANVPFVEVAPDWICEVLSPSTHKIDRSEKMDIYLRERVKHAWLVDPLEQTLEVYRLQNDLWARVAVFHGNAKVRAEPFDAIELPLQLLWER